MIPGDNKKRKRDGTEVFEVSLNEPPKKKQCISGGQALRVIENVNSSDDGNGVGQRTKDFTSLLADAKKDREFCLNQIPKAKAYSEKFCFAKQTGVDILFLYNLEGQLEKLIRILSSEILNAAAIASCCCYITLELFKKIKDITNALAIIRELEWSKATMHLFEAFHIVKDKDPLFDEKCEYVEKNLEILFDFQKHYFYCISKDTVNNVQSCLDLGQVGLNQRETAFAVKFFKKATSFCLSNSQRYNNTITSIYLAIKSYKSHHSLDEIGDRKLIDYFNSIEEIHFKAGDDSSETEPYSNDDEQDT